MAPLTAPTKKPAPTTSAPAKAAGAAPAKSAREDLRKAAGAAGFAGGSRLLSPVAPAAADATKVATPAPAPAVTRHVNRSISDTPYGWQSKFDVTFTDKECLVAIRMKFDAQEGVTAEDVAKVQADSSAAFTQFFDNKFKLTDNGSKKSYPMRVQLVFSDKDPHLVVKLRKGKGRDNLSNWYVQSEPIVRAHELGHQLGLKDEYIDPGAESRKDASAPGVRTDNSLMGNFWAEGVKTATVKPRHAQDIAGLIGGATGSTYTASEVK